MQREIEFRIWDEESQEMISWDQIKAKDFYVSTLVAWPNLCQFTGLLDSKGRKIFEGDILVYRPDYTESLGGQRENLLSLVKFENGAFMFGDEIAEQELANLHQIRGNIFEHSNLLK